ncbi:hypothetical protein GPECTOR_68g383 [Gonium pectorale]|uniref:tRNA pseudouridine synthase n=1 Tax=Gonium pectorale TaxID=33097 RepID=A0A150G3M9_GONPE|nr:hypothetical protein GPECTOR_68g383 [Gonium pectorale]|eukprot:KXZ44411.1 hypothetical protein GPECTOR_68g383 [Gonium pectorale]
MSPPTSPGWDTWLQREFLYANRDWQAVTDFFGAVVRGEASLADLGLQLAVSYLGGAFSGWQSHPGRVTVQGTLQAALQALVPPGSPKVLLAAAGRTDAGVHANGMPVSFYSWQRLPPERVLAAVSSALPGRLAALAVEERPRQFHATFSARWRRYVYLFPLREEERAPGETGGGAGTSSPEAAHGDSRATPDPLASVCDVGSAVQHAAYPDEGAAASCDAAAATIDGTAGGSRPYIPPEVYELDPDPVLLGRMLSALQGASLDFGACARDTPSGKDSACTLHVCRSSVVALPRRRPQLPPTTAAAEDRCARTGEPHPPPQSSHGPLQPCALPEDTSWLSGPCPGAVGGGGCSHAAAGQGSGTGAGPPAERPGSGPTRRGQVRVLCVELVGNRFLRKMVRVLVSTALREATRGAGRCGGRPDALLECLAAGRDATGMPAPATGLCFAGAGYEDGGDGAALPATGVDA